jgi:serine palmitoyltransferase
LQIELKKKYKYRLMLDETWSFGALGKMGKGLSELYNVPVRTLEFGVRGVSLITLIEQASEIDIIMGSMAVGLCSGGGFCAGSSVAVSHQRINSAAYVFSASLPPLLAVAANEGLSYLSGAMSSNGQLPLATLSENVRALRAILDKLENIIYIPTSPISPLIHVHIRRSEGLSFYDQERLLQEIVDDCFNNGVLVGRTKKVWKQESVEVSPSLRIIVSSALTKKEVEKAANTIKVSDLSSFLKCRILTYHPCRLRSQSALTSKLGKRK